jgi:hypothetical protein
MRWGWKRSECCVTQPSHGVQAYCVLTACCSLVARRCNDSSDDVGFSVCRTAAKYDLGSSDPCVVLSLTCKRLDWGGTTFWEPLEGYMCVFFEGVWAHMGRQCGCGYKVLLAKPSFCFVNALEFWAG